MSATALLPLTVLLPLAAAALVLAIAHYLAPWISDVVAVLVSLCVAAMTATIAVAAARHGAPILHWFGGWDPGAYGSGGLTLGIAFRADPVSAAIATFVALLFAATFVFAWGYFDHIHSHFQVLMLIFLAGMVGFCLTGDLFNLFVWFELMSISAFALTAYPLGQSALDGAFNFIVTNALAGFMMLAACGLVYVRTDALDMMAAGEAAHGLGRDPVLLGAFVLFAAGLLTKAAILPYHLWLADAHAVAPSPVSVIFSGAMVPVALFGFAKIYAVVFARDAALLDLVRPLLIALGGATALIAGTMAWGQRHLKRLLAFSTISHMGIMLAGAATLAPAGLTGLGLYLIGHGLVKGALFMIAGIMLALGKSTDEIVLYARGRRYWPAGVAMIAGGLLLAELPLGLMHGGSALIKHAVPSEIVLWLIATGEILTGAAIMRAGLRIFFGVSGVPGPELLGPTERESEANDRPFALMFAPAAVMIAAAFVAVPGAEAFVGHGFAAMTGRPALAHLPPPPTGLPWDAIVTCALAVLTLGIALSRRRPQSSGARLAFTAEKAPFRALEYVHSGLVGDYVTWTALGLALFAAWIGLR